MSGGVEQSFRKRKERGKRSSAKDVVIDDTNQEMSDESKHASDAKSDVGRRNPKVNFLSKVFRLPSKKILEVDDNHQQSNGRKHISDANQQLSDGSDHGSDAQSSEEREISKKSSPDDLNEEAEPIAKNIVKDDTDQQMSDGSGDGSDTQSSVDAKTIKVNFLSKKLRKLPSKNIVKVDTDKQDTNGKKRGSDAQNYVEQFFPDYVSYDCPPSENIAEDDSIQEMPDGSEHHTGTESDVDVEINSTEEADCDKDDSHAYFFDEDVPSDDSKIDSGFNGRIENKETGNVYIGEIDMNRKMSGYGQLRSGDGKQYIIGEWEENHLIKLICLQFTYNIANNRDCYARLYGEDALFTLDENNFVARVNIGNVEQDFSCIALSPGVIPQIVCKNLTIIKIIEDEMSLARDSAYNKFTQLLQDTKCTTANDIESADDLVQLYKTLKQNENSNSPSRDVNTSVLNDLLNNEYISSTLRDVTTQLAETESVLHARNRLFPQIDIVQLESKDFSTDILNICAEGFEQHKHDLIAKCSKQSFSLLISCLNKLSGLELLYISTSDVGLISDLIATTLEHPYATNEIHDKYTPLLLDFITCFCNNLIQQVKSSKCQSWKKTALKDVAPLTMPVYLYIYKQFLEVMLEISSITQSSCDLLTNKTGKWALHRKLDWSPSLLKNQILAFQFQYLFELLEYFSPRCKTDRTGLQGFGKENRSILTNVKHWLLADKGQTTNMTEEHLLWLHLIDGATDIIDQYHKKHHQRNEHDIHELAKPLLVTFKEFLTRNENQFEAIRVTANNIIKFITQISISFANTNVSGSDIVKQILQRQISYIGKLILCQKQCELSDYFSTLMSVFIGYWECWESVQPIPTRFPFGVFKATMGNISTRILQLVVDALSIENVTPPALINYFRSFIEFLKHLDGVDFAWYVKKDGKMPDFTAEILKVVDADNKSYEVLKPTEFIAVYAFRNIACPKHYVIQVIETLISVLSDCLLKNVTGTGWNGETHMSATSKLLLTIGRSFLHFREQTKNVDFEQFLIDCTQPFRNVVDDRRSYEDFVKRVENIETLYLYTRKQQEIGITQALCLFKAEAETLPSAGFVASFDEVKLTTCYDKYSKHFYLYIQKTECSVNKIGIIKDAVDKQIRSASGVKIGKWTTEFKMNTLPLILAGLAAVWSIHNSKDAKSTGMSLKPHCIQILCILRLLNVDEPTIGVENHLAQILTGQGKSLVLALFGTLLALLGTPVRVVCYSKYLADRDYQDFKDFFSEFDVYSDIEYGTFDDMANEVTSPEIAGKKHNLRTLVNQCALNTLEDSNTNIGNLPKPSSKVLLIDEVDVFFSGQFYGKTYNPSTNIGTSALVDIQTSIWNAVTSGLHTNDAVLKKIDELIERIVKDTKNPDQIFVDFYCTTENLFKTKLIKMIDDAIAVVTAKLDDWAIRDYKLDDDGFICCRDTSSGNYSRYTMYGYYNVFNYFRLKRKDFDHKNYQNFGYITIACGKISYAFLPTEYSIISGVSGTITKLNNSEKQAIKSYHVNHISSMPSFFGATKLVFNKNEHLTITSSKDEWLTTIRRNINSKVQAGRAVLVFFHIDSVITEFWDQYKSGFARLHLLTGIEEKAMLELFIDEAGVAGTVTLASRIMGRGVDFKSCDSSVEAKGGVHVIQTFFSMDEKEETQIKGRTARKSNRGSYEMILCEEHLTESKLIEGDDTSYDGLARMRAVISEGVGSNNAENIKVSLEKHKQTISFLKSFSQYTRDQRLVYLRNAQMVAE